MTTSWFFRQKRMRIACGLVGLSLATTISVRSQAQDAQDAQKSCREFVQSFYDWYIKHPAWPRALKYRPSAFSPELYRRLHEDHEAQAKVPGDVAGLDFDPILNSQDPGDHYTVGHIDLKNKETCWAEIYEGSPGENSKQSYVAAELANSAGRWQLVNFYYSSPNSDFSASVSHGGLLALLRELREARQKAKPPARAEPQDSVAPAKHPRPVSEPTPRN